MGDLLGSVGAIVAAIVIYLTGWTPIDPILSVLVAALILRSAWKLLAKSIHILLEGAPEDASPEKVEQGLMGAVPGLAAVSHVRVGSPPGALWPLHVRPNVDEEARAVVKRVEAVLREQFSIEHATVGIGWNSGTDENVCSLQPTSGVRTTAATITAVMTTAGTTTAAMIMAITSMAAGTATAMTTTIPLLVTGIEAARATPALHLEDLHPLTSRKPPAPTPRNARPPATTRRPMPLAMSQSDVAVSGQTFRLLGDQSR